MTHCIRCLVSGRVQGVAYRASAQRQAERTGITGYARNLPDGRVEVLACGEAEALERFRAWLAEGPALARVESVDAKPVEMRPPEDFRTG